MCSANRNIIENSLGAAVVVELALVDTEKQKSLNIGKRLVRDT
jgi:hypothetical protein